MSKKLRFTSKITLRFGSSLESETYLRFARDEQSGDSALLGIRVGLGQGSYEPTPGLVINLLQRFGEPLSG